MGVLIEDLSTERYTEMMENNRIAKVVFRLGDHEQCVQLETDHVDELITLCDSNGSSIDLSPEEAHNLLLVLKTIEQTLITWNES